MTKNCIILIPALNPPDCLLSYLAMLRKNGFTQILLVDDGSRPDRKALFSRAKAQGCTVLSHAKNKGRGAAIKTGIAWYLEHCSNRCDGIITVNSDGRDSITDILKFADALTAERAKPLPSLIIGVRDLESPHIARANRIGNKISRLIYKVLLGIEVQDTLCGLRGIPDKLLPGCLDISCNHYEYDTAVLIQHAEFHYIEIPVQAAQPDPDTERHYRAVQDTFQIYLVIFKRFLLFALVSISVSVFDIFLFWLFETFLLKNMAYPIIWSTILARIISATVNYVINRYVVFESNADHKKTAGLFVVLSIGQCLLSAVLVHLLELLSSGEPVLLKVLVDTMLFFVNYKIQHKFIFTREIQP